MHRNRWTVSVTILSSLVFFGGIRPPSAAADDASELQRAIKLYDGGDYVAAQETLVGINRDKLSRKQQQTRDDYLNRVQVAIRMSEKAIRDLEDAETAVAEGEKDRAVVLLDGVLTNAYAAEAVREAARAKMRELQDAAGLQRAAGVVSSSERNEPPPAASGATAVFTEPSAADLERARVLTQEADDMVRGGRYAEAERLYQQVLSLVPGYPEAVEGLRRARQHGQTAAGTVGESLIERLRRDDEINWQRTEAEYREIERSIRAAVTAERFAESNQLLPRARQVVEAGRQFADPISRYEALRAEVDALAAFVGDQERAYNEARVAAIQREVEDQRSRRLREIEEKRKRQVDALLEQAARQRKDGDLEGAVNTVRQITFIDPTNLYARYMLDMLEDQRQYRGARQDREELYDQTRKSLQDVERAKIPWHEQIKYPKDWLELISRPDRIRPGQARPDAQLHGMLDAKIPVDFRRDPFHQVIEKLADAHRVNIIVNWNDLERAGVERITPVDLSLPREITLRKAITEILDQVGGGETALGFDVADGAVTIATQAFLDRKTFAAMYDINDLLMTIPRWDRPPMTDLRHANQQEPPPPPKQSGSAVNAWRQGDDDDDEAETDPERISRVRQIIDLIQDTVAPDSWRERGGSIGAIKEINGQLIVTQNTAGQRQIADLLSKLREERAMQVAVEALFITVSSHYLEDLGMNLNFAFNSGNAGFDYLPGGTGPLVDPILGTRLLLPRTFSRIGITPAPPGVGTPTGTDPSVTPVPQPYGQPFLVPRPAGGSGSRLTPIPVTSGILDITDPANQPSDIPGSFGGQQIPPALGISGSFLDNIQVDFLIRATQADSRTSVLTAPKVVVFNGFGAWVAVTIQQNFVSALNPVVGQQAVAQAPVIGTIDAGAVLNIQQAVVTADKRYVMMVLSPGVTRLIDLQTFAFSGGTAALNAFVQIPTLSSLRVQTAVSVPDGGTLLIGGQKLASESEVEAGVPVLSKIPILKRAYSSRSMVKDEQTLLILVKPKILIQSEQEELAFPSFARNRD